MGRAITRELHGITHRGKRVFLGRTKLDDEFAARWLGDLVRHPSAVEQFGSTVVYCEHWAALQITPSPFKSEGGQ